MKKWLLVFTVLVVPACLDSTADPESQGGTSALASPVEVSAAAITPCLSACAERFDACVESASGRGRVCGCRIGLAVCQQGCGLTVTPPNC